MNELKKTMKNETALITGASSGIGYELAKVHAAQGGNLILVARREDRLLAIQKEIEGNYKVKVSVIALDLSQPNAAAKLYKTTKQKSISVDYLINNAGFGDVGAFSETNWDKEASMIDLNMKALTHLTKIYLPDMLERKSGRIMNVASTAAFLPGPLMAIYYATKHYVLAFSEALASELQGTGVTVTALCPGITQSEFQEVANLNTSKMGRVLKVATSEEVARYGYRKMIQGKTVAIHGSLNKLVVLSVRFTPRSLARAMVKKLHLKKE